VPGLFIDTTAPISGSSNAAVVYQRGVGQTEFLLTNDPGVGIYQDGVFLPRAPGSVLNTVDIERVEVLRGANGVLWGNNIGGAINVISREPGAKPGGEARLTLGGDNRRDVSLALNQPLVDDVLLSRITVADQQQDGYVKRLSDGDKLGDNNEQYFRGQLLWLPTDDFSARLVLDKNRAREHSAPTVMLDDNPVLFNANVAASALGGPYNTTAGSSLPGPFPCCGPDGQYDARYLTGSHYKNWGTGPDESDLDTDGASLTAEYAIDPDTKLVSITAYRELHATFGRDPDNSPITYLQTANNIRQKQFSEEVRLQGNALDKRLDWLTGLWYLDENGRDALTAGIVPALYGTIGVPLSIAGNYDAGSTVWAGYGQATWHFDEQWSATYGLRYTEDTKTFQNHQYLSDTNQLFLPSNPHSNRFEHLTNFVSGQYQFTPDVLAYLSYSEGFKSGGYVARYIAPQLQPSTFDSETVNTWELGLKVQALDHTLTANTALFESAYDDIQLLVFRGIVPVTQNAGQARIRGLEEEIQWEFLPGWTLAGNAAWMDTDYLSVDGTSPIRSNNLFVNTPEWSAHLALIHDWQWDSIGKLQGGADYSWQGMTARDAINTPQLIQGSYSVVNGWLTLTPAASELDITLYGKNLTDEEYLISGVADIATFGAAEGAYSRPRELGVSLAYRF
jgi:iron complex outermembrane receptor protein